MICAESYCLGEAFRLTEIGRITLNLKGLESLGGFGWVIEFSARVMQWGLSIHIYKSYRIRAISDPTI